MARGRFISESVAKDMRLNSLSVEAELVYLMTIPHLDRDGLIEGDTDVLYGTVCPKRRIFIDCIGEFVQEWVRVGLVIMYDSDEGSVLWFTGFAKNQLGLRYDRETPSKFPPPPGHIFGKDGIVTAPPSSNPPTVDNAQPVSGELPEASDNGVAQWQDQVEVKDQVKGGDRARATVTPAAPNPPSSYRTAIQPDEYIPGVNRPRNNQTKRNADAFMTQATAHGIGPEPFRLMVDAVLVATGKIALANTNGELGQQALNQAKETVVTLLEMKRKTIEDIDAVLASWRQDDWRGASTPTFSQIVEHASAMDAGTHVTAKRQDTGKKEFASFADYNEWARGNDPDYKRIREGVLIKGMLVKRDSYQPAMVH